MRKLKNKRFRFNMIEIMLAIAILAFGFASVLGLFPVAIKAVRSSQAEGLANDAANNVYVYYKGFANAIKSPGVYFYKDIFVNDSIIAWEDQDNFRTSSFGNDFLSALKAFNGPIVQGSVGFQPGMNLFQPVSLAPCFFLVLGSADFKKTEFTAQIIVWRNKVDRLATPATPAPAPPQFTYEQAVELNMEVSWPINIPYDDREKRYYQFVITNPTP